MHQTSRGEEEPEPKWGRQRSTERARGSGAAPHQSRRKRLGAGRSREERRQTRPGGPPTRRKTARSA
eukprot:9502141-Pyramimonas_sp.AAC.1